MLKKSTKVGRQRTTSTKEPVVHYTRDGRRRPKRCTQYVHAYGCRPGRPLCWQMRLVQAAKYGVCNCGVVHYPHRAGYCTALHNKLCNEEEAFLREREERKLEEP